MRSAIALIVIVGLLLGVGGWVFSDEIRSGVLELGDFEHNKAVEVVAVSAREIELTWRDIGETELARDEVAGVVWDGGYGRVTGLVERREGNVVREFRAITGGLPQVGERVAIDEYAWPDDPGSLGLEFTEEMIEGELGPLPAWHIPSGADADWVVLVHGRNDRGRVEMLRLVPFLHEAGYNILIPTYRNDRGAPQVESRRVGFGLTEWTDLGAAMTWVEEQDAGNVSIIGFSMGAAITLSWMLNAPDQAASLQAVVLDSPATDIERTIELQAMERDLPIPYLHVKVPSILADVAILVAGERFGFDFSDVDYVARAADLPDVPILVLHGTEDVTVPIETSRAFSDAAVRARLVELFGGHTRMWNVDPAVYEGQVLGFFDRYRK